MDWIRICMAITIFATSMLAFVAIASRYHFRRKAEGKEEEYDPFCVVGDGHDEEKEDGIESNDKQADEK